MESSDEMDAGLEAGTTSRLTFLTLSILIRAKEAIEGKIAMTATKAIQVLQVIQVMEASKTNVKKVMSWLGRLLTWSMETTLAHYPAIVVAKNFRLCV